MDKKITNIKIEDSGISARRYISGNELFVNGHYPHHAIFPGVLSIELLLSLIEYYCFQNNNKGSNYKYKKSSISRYD